MLEGLEIAEIKLSECKSVIDFRIDSNTYKKDYLITETLIKSKPNKSLEKISISVQNFGAYSLCNFINFTEEGIPFLMTKNVRENFIDWNIEKHIDQASHDMLWKSHCKKGQVLITMAGEYLGRVAVYNRDEVISSNQAIAKVTLRSDQNPYLISTFLNSKHGQNQIQRYKTITGQPNINMSLIKALRIPDFKSDFSKAIKELVLEAEDAQEKSRTTYTFAENLLLEKVGLANVSLSTKNINIKSFKDSFSATGRLDAEYYQPKYEQVIMHIVAQSHERLNKLVNIQKSIEPGSGFYTEDEEGLPFLRVADYDKFGLTMPQKKLESAFVTENSAKLNALKPKKGTILFSKDGSVGEAYCLHQDAYFITSSAILHLTILDVNKLIPEYLTLVLNSKLVKMQAERDAGGSVILHWRVGEIENVVVPLVGFTTQMKIANAAQESFTLKSKSERLLEIARRAVEIAIEDNQENAMTFISNQSKD